MTSRKASVISVLFAALIVSDLSCLAEDADKAKVAVVSLQEVNTVCLGQIVSEAKYLPEFQQYLKESLVKKGFQITETGCDATLVGHLKTSHKLQITGSQLLAWARVKLVNSAYKVLWEDECRPYFSLKNPDFVWGDGRSGCAANISKRLADAKRNIEQP